MNTVRCKVYKLFRDAIERLKPVGSDDELDSNHYLYPTYQKYIAEPTETGEAKADEWLERIYELENLLYDNPCEYQNTPPAGWTPPTWLLRTGVPSDKILTDADFNWYADMRSTYPSNINLIAESVVSPVELSASPDRTPAIFYRVGSVRPHPATQTNTKTESISLIIYAIVLDRSRDDDVGPVVRENHTLFNATSALTDAMYNAISDVKSESPTEYGNIETEFISRPLREGTGSGEIVRFDIQITYDFYISRLS